MLCLQLCCNNGRDDISRSLSHDTAHTSERASVRSLPKVSKSVSCHGPSMPYPRFCTFPSSCSSLASLFSFATSISRSSGWCYHGLAFAWVSTGVSPACQLSVMTVHITRHSHCRRGTLLQGHDFWSIGFFDGSLALFSFIFVPSAIFITLSYIAYITWKKVVTNHFCRECRRPSRKRL